jgi:hypothetical protein
MTIQPVTPRQLLKSALLLGALLTVGGLLFTLIFRTRADLTTWYPLDSALMLGEIALGLGLGIGAAGLVWGLTERIKWLADLRERLALFLPLDQIGWGYALLFGLLAGIPEEIFFRGALQPTLGLLLTALFFGLLHAISPIYILFTILAGVLLGGLAQSRGDLWAATCAHAAYDACLLWQLGRWERQLARQIQTIDR